VKNGRLPTPKKGIAFALVASLLFGVSTPAAKVLLSRVDPVLLAGLFYIGSGLGLAGWKTLSSLRRADKGPDVSLRRGDWPWLLGAIAAGGVCAPVLLTLGLASTPASSASLLLNLEGVFTALLAWFVFKENCDRRIVCGMIAIVIGGVILSSNLQGGLLLTAGSLLIIGACLAWGLDNNLTRKIAHADPLQIAMLKGLAAGCINIAACLVAGKSFPAPTTIGIAALIGFFSYGLSLVLYVLALRHIGAARTGAYFSFAPFVGAAISILALGEPATYAFMIASVFMGAGLWLHVTERHEHEHVHAEIEHEHGHVHDEHHQHEHGPADPAGEPHSHLHRHEQITHTHPHFPDTHHEHEH
jgi:drug/metabolite transporter (DMT)-like permease